MKEQPMAGIERVVDFVLAATAAPETRAEDDHRNDLVMLGTIADGRAFWPCQLWGATGHRSDFVHVSRACHGRDDHS